MYIHTRATHMYIIMIHLLLIVIITQSLHHRVHERLAVRPVQVVQALRARLFVVVYCDV